MATYAQNTDINGAGVGFTLASGDTLIVGRDADIFSVGDSGVYSPGSARIYVYGSVFGFNGIRIEGRADIFIGATGVVTGMPSSDALSIEGDFLITNYGEVSAVTSGGYGFQGDGSGTFTNFGTVTGGNAIYLAGGPQVTTSVINYGNILGTTQAYVGSSGADRLNNQGLIQGNILMGGGNDTFVVGSGRVGGTINGGIGSDTISFADFGRGIVIDLPVGLTWDGVRNERISDFENGIGTAFNDIMAGNEFDNTFNPGAAGADVFNGNLGSDTISYVDSIRAMVIDLSVSLTWDGVENDTLISVENGIGSRYNDVLFGDGGNNVFDGGASGADALYGNGGIDTVSYATSDRSIRIDMPAGLTWDGVQSDTISGFENAIGSRFGDTIFGDGGANTITGGLGGDIITTGGGADRIVAVAVADLNSGSDTITDFVAGVDKLVFNSADGYSSGANFVSSAAPVAPNGNAVFLYNSTTGGLSYDVDGTGAQFAVLVETLSNKPALSLADFSFV